MMAIAALAFVGCGDDDDNNATNPSSGKPESVAYIITADFSTDLLSVADVTAYYINEKGSVASEAITTTTWTKTVTQKLPCKIGCKIAVALKKANIEDTKTYTILCAPDLNATVLDKNGKKLKTKRSSLSIKSSKLAGSKLEDYFSRNKHEVALQCTTNGDFDTTTIDWGI